MGDLLATRVVVTDLARFRNIGLSDSARQPAFEHILGRLEDFPGGSFEVRDNYYILSCDMHVHPRRLKRSTQIIHPKMQGNTMKWFGPGKSGGRDGSGHLPPYSRGRSGMRAGSMPARHRPVTPSVSGSVTVTNIVIHHRALRGHRRGTSMRSSSTYEGLEDLENGLRFRPRTPGRLVPTTNQVSRMLQGLNLYDILVTEVTEIFLRSYKHVPGRLRPLDRMVAHTGFLIFARKLRPGSYKPFQKDVPVFEEDDEPDAG